MTPDFSTKIQAGKIIQTIASIVGGKGGGKAAMLYGEPRATHEIDLFVFLRATDIAKLPKLDLPPEFYLPPPEAIAVEMARPQHGC